MKRLTILAVAVLLVFLVGCDSSYNADNYAETLIDLELDGEYGIGESNKALSVERMGFELSDYYAYELELAEDMTLAREVNEELIALAPAPEDIADFYYELLDGEENTPIKNLPVEPEFVNGVLQDIENGLGYYSLVWSATEGLNLKSSLDVETDGIVDYLEDYNLTPRSIAALSLLSNRRGSGYSSRPVEEYFVNLTFEMVKPLEKTVPLEQYVDVHTTALAQILEGETSTEAAYKHGLEQAGLSKEDVDAQNALLDEWSMIQQAITEKIAWELQKTMGEYEDENGMTVHLASKVKSQEALYRDEFGEGDVAFYGDACAAYGLPKDAMDSWTKVAETYNNYLDSIGKSTGLNANNLALALGSLFKAQGERALEASNNAIEKHLSAYNISLEAFSKYLTSLMTDAEKYTALQEAAGEIDDDLSDATDAFLAKRISDAYLEELKNTIVKYRNNQSSNLGRGDMPFMQYVPNTQVSNIPRYTPGSELANFDRTDCTAVEFAVGTIASTRTPDTINDTISFEYNTIEAGGGSYPVVHYNITYIWTEDGERWEITKPIALAFGSDDGRLVVQKVYEVNDFYLSYYLTEWSPGSISIEGNTGRDVFSNCRMPSKSSPISNIESEIAWDALDALLEEAELEAAE